MANAIKPKSTSTTSKVPTSNDLLVGELGCNIADGVLFLKKSDNSIATFNTTSGTVTSVAISVPTGLSVTGTPITTSGTFAITLSSGYSIPTTTKQGQWDTAYSNYLQWDGGSTNLVAATARTSLGLVIGTNVQAWDADLDSIAALAGTSGLLKKTAANTWSLDTTAYGSGTVTSVAALTLGTTGTDLSSSVATGTTTPVITLNVPSASATNRGALTSGDWTNFNTAYTNRITSLTTTGSSGSATLTSNTLNIPTYTLAGLGGQSSSTNLTSLAGLSYVSASFVKMTAAGTFSLDTSTYLTANQSITLSGDVTGSGTTAITTTLSTVSIAKGGTGQTTQQAAINALTGTQSSGKFLRSDGTNATLSSIQSADVPTLNQNTTGTASNVTGIVALANGGTAANLTAVNGGVVYSTASALAVSSAGTSGQLLQSNGAAAPSWVASPGVPTGSLFPFAGSAAPTGYLLCDGSAVARTGTYAALFAVIGTTYGAGDGSTTFNLPDLRGRMPLGAGTGVGLNASGTGKPAGTNQTARTAGQWGGEETNLLTTNEMPSHNHNGATGNAGSHAHSPSDVGVFVYRSPGGYQPTSGGGWMGSGSGTFTNTVADHSHTINSQGGGARHATMPPFIVANYIIKT